MVCEALCISVLFNSYFFKFKSNEINICLFFSVTEHLNLIIDQILFVILYHYCLKLKLYLYIQI